MNNDNIYFIWIPKTAGSSLFKEFKKQNCKKLKNLSQIKNFNNKGFVTFGHIHFKYLLKEKLISKEFFNNSFKFSFVRNPWDRLVSLYFYFKKYSYNGINRFETFDIFINYIYNNKISSIGGYNVKGFSQCNPQTDWILLNNKKITNFIGKFENLDNDYDKLCKILNLSKLKLLHSNRSNHLNYKNYYNDYLKNIVKKIYLKDIEMFKYTF